MTSSSDAATALPLVLPEIEAWVTSWLAGRSQSAPLSPSANYFEAGIIDSFGAIEFVEDIENRFGIRFSEQDFQDRRFYTAGGVAAIVAEKSAR